MSLIDYDELECKFCGNIGLVSSGGDYDVECPVCDAEYSLCEDEYEDEEYDEEDDD